MMKLAALAALVVLANGSSLNTPQDVCASTEYCCPDAKHCLTPTTVVCDPSQPSEATCGAKQACCPLTHLCVDVGAACTSPCADQGSYCCPDAKHCLTPTKPGQLCKGAFDCAKTEVCCPVIHECVSVGAACTPPTAPAWVQV